MLQSEIAQVRGRGADEYDAASRAGLGESGALAEEPVARVDRLRAGAHGGIEQRLHGKIALRRRGRTDLDRFIRRAHMERVAVGRRIDRHRGHGHAPQRAYDAAGDGAAIGDEYLAEHQFSAAIPDQHLHRRRVVGVAGIVELRAIADGASTSVSARISTYLPGSEMPSSNVSLPSGVTGTFMKKLILLVMSRFVHAAGPIRSAL